MGNANQNRKRVDEIKERTRRLLECPKCKKPRRVDFVQDGCPICFPCDCEKHKLFRRD